jgi:tryptophanyl-tRNA synthetase
MSISNNIHNIAVLDTSEMIQEYSIEETVDGQKKKVQKKTATPLKFACSSYALAPKTRREYKEMEAKIAQGDQEILEMKEARNSLEAYAYEMR